MILSWGKPRIIIRKIGDATNKIIELYTPVEDSAELTTTKGTKKEAKIEGGENEAIKYSKNTYALGATIRSGSENGTPRKKPFSDSDGVVEGEYELFLQPENPEAPGLHMQRCTVSVEDGWTASDGGTWIYTFDAVKETDHDQVEWGKVEITGKYLNATAVTFTENTAPTTANS